MSPRLDEIAMDWEVVDQLLEFSGGEVTPEVEASIACVSLAERAKADSYVWKIKALQGDEDALKALEEEIAAKRSAKKRLREHLLARVRAYMDERKIGELQGEVWRFKLCKSGKPPVEVLVPPEELPEGWRITEVRANKEAIRTELERCVILDSTRWASLARLGEPTLSLRVF